jgi:hypothetical protein
MSGDIVRGAKSSSVIKIVEGKESISISSSVDME